MWTDNFGKIGLFVPDRTLHNEEWLLSTMEWDSAAQNCK
jgi:hypothetical protein